MPHFPISTLPNEVQTAVLCLTKMEDSLKLLKTTKPFRQYYLINGLCPKRVNKIKLSLCTDASFVSAFGDLEIAYDKWIFDVGFHLNWDHIAGTHHMYLDYHCQKYEREKYISYVIAGIRSCRTIIIDLTTDLPECMLKRVFQTNKLLSNVREVANLRISPQILNFYCPKVDRELQLLAGNIRIDQSLFEKEALRNTKAYCLPGIGLDFRCFSQTEADLSVYEFYESTHLEESLRSLVQGEWPGKNRSATVILACSRYYRSSDHEKRKREVEKEFLLQRVSTLEGSSSELEWICSESGQSKSMSAFKVSVHQANSKPTKPDLTPFLDLENTISGRKFLLINVARNFRYFGYFRERRHDLMIILRTYGLDSKVLTLQAIIKQSPNE